jgi:hypothetical protein
MRDRRAADMVALAECGLRCPKEGNAACGVRHSDVNTKVDFGSCSRCSDRSARVAEDRMRARGASAAITSRRTARPKWPTTPQSDMFAQR